MLEFVFSFQTIKTELRHVRKLFKTVTQICNYKTVFSYTFNKNKTTGNYSVNYVIKE